MNDPKAVIFEAARKRFAHYGLAKTTMNDIAADVGMSKASLYYYFPDKESLFMAVVEEDFDEFSVSIHSLLVKPSKASFKLKKYVKMRQEVLARLSNLAKIEAPAIPEAMRIVYDGLRKKMAVKERQLVAAILTAGIDAGEFEKISVDTYADLFVTLLSGLRVQALASRYLSDSPDHDDSSQHALLLVDLFLKAVRR